MADDPRSDRQLAALEARIERAVLGDAVDEATFFTLLGEAVGVARIFREERDQVRRPPAAVYVALIEDRHADPEPVVFTAPELAVEYARRWAQEHALTPEDYEEREVAGWLFHASYSPESDSVSVTEKTVHVSLDSAM